MSIKKALYLKHSYLKERSERDSDGRTERSGTGNTDRIRRRGENGNYHWVILDGKGGEWPQKYKTRENAVKALAAYHINS